MTLMPSKRLSGLAAVYGSTVYLFFSHISMLFYAGGTPWDRSTTGYHYWYNFLSDLGETIAKNGNPNLSSAIMMNSSLVLIGITLIIFYLNVSYFLNRRWAGILATGCGIFSSIGLILIGIAPSNTMKSIHLIGVYMWALGLLLALGFLLFCNKKVIPNWLTILTTLLLGLVAYHMGQGIYNVRGTPITIIQKIVFNLNVIWYIVMGWILTNSDVKISSD